MGIQDLMITPIYLLLLGAMAYLIRPLVTTTQTLPYFLPALFIRFFGAIALGLIYQFYYGGGDTFNYFTHGSEHIWRAFKDDYLLGLSMLMERGGERVPETFAYSQHIWYYRDVNSYFIVRLTGLFDLLTFHTYSATALFFAGFSFSGLWAMFTVLVKKFPEISARWLAVGVLFFPSTIFWGSGILKDSITLGALGWLTWSLVHLLELQKWKPRYFIPGLMAIWLIYSIKVYILICFLPLVFVWIYWQKIGAIKSMATRILIAPALLVFLMILSFWSLNQIASESPKYSLDNVARQAQMTAYDIRYGWGARMEADGGYDIGLPDGTIPGTLKLMPKAINVALFRPYLWEVKNPLMLMAALESLILLILTIRMLLFRKGIKNIAKRPFLIFCLFFALLFSFAVGVSTFNFGTLMRYKIPMLPFYLTILAVGSRAK